MQSNWLPAQNNNFRVDPGTATVILAKNLRHQVNFTLRNMILITTLLFQL